jgi:hypothetical protein
MSIAVTANKPKAESESTPVLNPKGTRDLRLE